jgi:hypothetical protein
MPFTYLPEGTYLRINDDRIEFICEGELISTMTAEQARSNAADLLDAADCLEGKGRWASPSS